MNDKLANDLIGLYEKGLEEFGVEIIDVKYGGRSVTLLVKIDGEEKEYSAAFQGGTVLDTHVSVLRKAYWEKKDPPKPKETKQDVYKELHLTEEQAAEIDEAIEKGTAKPRIEVKPVEEKEKPMTGTLTYKDVYKQ